MTKKWVKLSVLLFASLLAGPTILSAQDKDNCAEVGELAATIMKDRQNGIAISKLMEVVTADSGEINSGIKKLIILAYKQPRYSSDGMQKQEIDDFRNQVELACYSE